MYHKNDWLLVIYKGVEVYNDQRSILYIIMRVGTKFSLKTCS